MDLGRRPLVLVAMVAHCGDRRSRMARARGAPGLARRARHRRRAAARRRRGNALAWTRRHRRGERANSDRMGRRCPAAVARRRCASRCARRNGAAIAARHDRAPRERNHAARRRRHDSGRGDRGGVWVTVAAGSVDGEVQGSTADARAGARIEPRRSAPRLARARIAGVGDVGPLDLGEVRTTAHRQRRRDVRSAHQRRRQSSRFAANGR